MNWIGSLRQPGRAVVEGRLRVVRIRPAERSSVFAAISPTPPATLTAMSHGREHIPGLMCASRVRLRWPVGIKGGRPVMVNPRTISLSPART